MSHIPIKTVITVIVSLGLAYSQNATGIVAASRSIDWGKAGVEGGVPNRAAIYTTLNPGATADQINAAIAACPAGQVVSLSAGTYSLAGGIVLKSDVTVRGAGADKTFLVFTGVNACFGGYGVVCFTAENHVWGGDKDAWPGGTNAAVWTAGFAQGTAQITLTNVGSSGIAVGQYLILDQENAAADNGELFVCDNTTFPCSLEGGNGGRVINNIQHGQTQIVKVTAINGSVYTISPALYAPTWTAALSPGAWWVRPMQNAGLEDLSINHDSAAGEINGISMYGAINCWVKGVRSVNSNRNHVQLCASAHNTIADCYFYGTQHGQTQSYGVEIYLGSDNLVINNIFQHVTAPQLLQLGVGDVIAYNFSINDYETASADFLYGSATDHNEGNEFDLLEGNDGSMFGADLFHGTGGMNTLFRNRFTGWEKGKLNNLIPVRLDSYKRYCNIVGNVLGTAGITINYQTPAPYGSGQVYALGGGNSNGTVTIPADPLVPATTMRWGNYDVVSDSARWEASEVPSAIAKYANPVPAGKTLPASFFLSAKPAWWPSAIAWPPIGPDVSGGALSGLAGHAHQIPACNCYANIMKGPADGSGDPLTFNADNCYTTAVSNAPANLMRQGPVSLSVRRMPGGHEWMIKMTGAEAKCRLTICDIIGRTVRTLAPDQSSANGARFFWDGRDNQGKSLSEGLYVIGIAGGVRKVVGIF
ncbi:MAG TPA: FlgD immunoglobulin-like domain containing protein [Chitinivibrionales bacterium]|nr:FlgD immunoglobulin-like domain containing protein [Chitinivibrionales bacterium]